LASFSDQPRAQPFVLAAGRNGPSVDALRELVQPRYVAAVAVATPLVGLALLRFGAGGRFAVASLVIAVLCVLAAIDLTERRIPNRLVLPTTAVVLGAHIVLFPERTPEWIIAAIGAALVLLVPLLLNPSGVGMGDVKLMLLLGAGLGAAVVTALVVGSIASAAYAAVLLVRNGGEARRRAFPLGPFLVFGAVVALLA
jgi:leader peptidase (prepilin peptidase)/N-methyltransferase